MTIRSFMALRRIIKNLSVDVPKTVTDISRESNTNWASTKRWLTLLSELNLIDGLKLNSPNVKYYRLKKRVFKVKSKACLDCPIFISQNTKMITKDDLNKLRQKENK